MSGPTINQMQFSIKYMRPEVDYMNTRNLLMCVILCARFRCQMCWVTPSFRGWMACRASRHIWSHRICPWRTTSPHSLGTCLELHICTELWVKVDFRWLHLAFLYRAAHRGIALAETEIKIFFRVRMSRCLPLGATAFFRAVTFTHTTRFHKCAVCFIYYKSIPGQFNLW